jgi:hypothetical protein
MEEMEEEALNIYTVYQHPSDYPDKWVVRRWRTLKGENIPDPEPLLVVDTHSEVRLVMTGLGLVCLTRFPDDDPCIAETWL